jgi:spermidine/putrescine transport system permease protein
VLSLETPLPSQGFKQVGYQFTWHFSQYTAAWGQYHVQFVRSLVYAGIVTLVTLVVGYPVAYWIAFQGGAQKTTYLFLILLPFFVSFVIRSLAWQFLLSSDGIVFSNLERVHLLPQGFHVLGTPTAVISGIAYNSLPFMVLPLYVSLEKIDRAVVEAANDLYASTGQAFLKVILPLSIPGIFAGFLLTFIPAVGDYVNNDILGGTNTTMIGNIVQREFLNDQNYPLASALAFILMIGLMIGILIYARILGTRQIEEYV